MSFLHIVTEPPLNFRLQRFNVHLILCTKNLYFSLPPSCRNKYRGIRSARHRKIILRHKDYVPKTRYIFKVRINLGWHRYLYWHRLVKPISTAVDISSGAGIRCFAQLEGCSPCTGASTMDIRCSCSFDVSFDTLCGNTRHRGLMVFSCSIIGGCVAPAMNALRIEALSALLLVFRGGVGCSMSGGFECWRL
ncbi:hypothetical protein TIFTF001_023151 [Ficus carica]|uniref:Uncharacterized protein n=1 Tax=Ficus carica TaxID=3494 RepID=A0AA88AZX1_FICCA|nr:hypothetical protein TIFTF001_023151 [Ficus carica]